MVQDLETTLRRLAAAPPHPGLASIEEAVLGRLHDRVTASPRQGFGIGSIVAAGALMMGIAAGGPYRSAASPDILSPFGPTSPLAPSTLLAASQ